MRNTFKMLMYNLASTFAFRCMDSVVRNVSDVLSFFVGIFLLVAFFLNPG